MDKLGKGIVAVADNVDTSGDDEMGRFFLHIMAALAEMERERLKRRMATSKVDAMERGVYPAIAPLGYHASVLSTDEEKGARGARPLGVDGGRAPGRPSL